MIIKEKKVYYCEFCSMHRLLSYTVRRHEDHCTLNPNRKCGMPGCSGVVSEEFIDKLISYAEENVVNAKDLPLEEREDSHTSIPEEFVNRLVDELECPWCVLAILRIANKRRPELNMYWSFDFKKLAKEMLDEANGYEEARNTYCE